jgi:prolyl oligopeptidase PreP (S9A serine peptidase family)
MGFKTFHINSEEVAEQRVEPYRTIMKQYLAREKARMTELQYTQQYLAQFLEELRQFFPDDLIRKCQVAVRQSPHIGSEVYCGIDIARMGGDECVFSIFERKGDTLVQIENIVKTNILTTQTTQMVLDLDMKYNFKRVYIDDGGLGVAVFDHLLSIEQTKRKVVAINNASRALDKDESRKKKLLKEDLYANLLRMMETDKIKFLQDNNIFLSLKSIVAEETSDKKEMRIYGRYSHIAESIIRSAWCVKEKHLNFQIYWV